MTNKAYKPRPTVEDYLRALGYLNLMVWAVLFYAFTPASIGNELDDISRLLWLSVSFAGAAMAFLGAILRIDIKLEYPGILFALIGPVFYAISRIYLTVFPDSTPMPGEGIALISYAMLPITLLLPRLVSLLNEKNRLKGFETR